PRDPERGARDDIEVRGRQGARKEAAPDIVPEVVRVETPERLTAAEPVPERHADRMQDGGDIRLPGTLFQRDHDAAQAVQLPVHRHGAPPTLAARRQAAREQALATLQQALDVN